MQHSTLYICFSYIIFTVLCVIASHKESFFNPEWRRTVLQMFTVLYSVQLLQYTLTIRIITVHISLPDWVHLILTELNLFFVSASSLCKR
jgi:hypothetical protein